MKQNVEIKSKEGMIPRLSRIIYGCIVVGIFVSLFPLSVIQRLRPRLAAAIFSREVQY